MTEFASELSDLMDGIQAQIPTLDALRLGAELYAAPRLSTFGILRPTELPLSRVVSDLFNPRGTHGQGPLFLNALLRHVDLPEASPREHVTVTLEVTIKNRRRIDLVIESPSFILGIENKPDARQSERQLDDYLEALTMRAGSRQCRLVFLSDQKPDCQGAVHRLGYTTGDIKALGDLLTEVLPRIRAPRTEAFVT